MLKRNVGRDTFIMGTDILARFFLSFPPSIPNFLTNPRHEIEVPTACKYATPENKLRGIDDHSQDIERRLKDWLYVRCLAGLDEDVDENEHTDMREKTSPAASMPTKMNEIPRTVW
jgi:hypothetical protein